MNIPRLAAARADSSIFGFALAVAILNGILFGIAPALRLARGPALAFSGFGVRGVAAGIRDRLRSSLIIAEVALSVVLVVIGGQLLASFAKLIATDPGFQPDHVLASIVLPAPERYRTPEQRGLFYKRIMDSVRALPGVESAGTTDALPFSGENHVGVFSITDASKLEAEIDVVGGEYLRTLGIRLLEGRWFQEEEMSESSDAAIVNDFIAARLWPGVSGVGQRICVCTPGNPSNWKRVVGVVSSARHSALNEPSKGNIYLAAGAMQSSDFLVARTARPTKDLEKAIRRAIAAIDPNQPVFLSASMTSLIADSVADRRFIMMLLAITASLALIMSSAGLYGVVSYMTSRRAPEFGIRVALGAIPRDVLALVFRQTFRIVLVGLTIGIGAAILAMHSLRAFLAGLDSTNPAYIWIASGVVASTAGIACWVPARRASRTDPISALRQE